MDFSYLRETIGERVRRHRQARGYSQHSLAQQCGMNRSYIGSLERGEHNVSLANLARIAAGLDVPLTELLGEAASQGAGKRRKQRQGQAEQPLVALNRKTFLTLLHQCASDRPDLVTVYLERFGIRFLD